MEPCPHDNVTQLSTIVGETSWYRFAEDGSMTCDAGTCDKVLSEDTISWTCDDCGEALTESDLAL